MENEEIKYLNDVIDHLKMKEQEMFKQFDDLSTSILAECTTIYEVEIVRKYKALMNKYR